MENLNLQFQEVINKNLPQQVGEALQKRLKEADGLEKEVGILKARVRELELLEKNLRLDNNTLESRINIITQKKETLNEKELNLFKLEKELTLREIRVLNEVTKRECVENSNKDLKELFSIAFKNPVVIENINESQSGEWHWDSNLGRNIFIPSGFKSIQKTKE